MPFVMWKDVWSMQINSPDHAEEVFWDEATRPPVGWMLKFGRVDREITDRESLPNLDEGEWPLRVDVDLPVGRATVRWLPDGTVGTEAEVGPCHTDLEVFEDTHDLAVSVPAEWARVTPGGAVKAIRQYIQTGQRPACLEWE